MVQFLPVLLLGETIVKGYSVTSGCIDKQTTEIKMSRPQTEASNHYIAALVKREGLCSYQSTHLHSLCTEYVQVLLLKITVLSHTVAVLIEINGLLTQCNSVYSK